MFLLGVTLKQFVTCNYIRKFSRKMACNADHVLQYHRKKSIEMKKWKMETWLN
jgi:hypothetical protein